jgi:hypothetical protein
MIDAVSTRAILATAIIVLGLTPATAVALPGDPDFAATAPADGATLSVDPNGIPVAFTCPVYRVSDAGGGFIVYGGARDYGASFSTSPALGADGRLADRVALGTGSAAPGMPESCVSGMNPGGANRPQETPGTYFWQLWRICTGCALGYESDPVLRFTLASSARPTLKLPARIYAGYPVIASVSGGGLPDGAQIGVERLTGGSWSRVAGDALVSGVAEPTVSLPKGGQRVRVSAVVGSQTVVSGELRRTVRGTSGKLTHLTSGSYRGTAGPGTRSASFRVKGRTLRDFKAQVAMLCPGVTAGQFTTQIGTALVSKIRVAPDGSFVGVATPARETAIRVRGRLVGAKLTGGRVELSVGTCTGDTSFRVRRV